MSFVLGLTAPWLRATWTNRATRPFWRPIAQSPLTVVLGRHDLLGWEPSGLMGVGDAKAIDELREYFRSLHLMPFTVQFVDEVPKGQTHDGTLLCIGGPDTSLSNGEFRITADLWRLAQTSFRWGNSAAHDIRLVDSNSGMCFAPDGFPTAVTRDYALIVRMPNPYAQQDAGGWAFFLRGASGMGRGERSSSRRLRRLSRTLGLGEQSRLSAFCRWR